MTAAKAGQILSETERNKDFKKLYSPYLFFFFFTPPTKLYYLILRSQVLNEVKHQIMKNIFNENSETFLG